MMNLVWTYITICVVLLALKFVHRVYKRMGDRTNMDDVIDRANEKMNDAADKVAGYWKETKNKKRSKKDEERPIVTIR